MKRIIVGTAGHIDHGKTALVQALTGVDADRLKEEKERGITIDLGFADLTLADIHFGFIDVPGHERFVRNMLAGAHGIDLVMLVVAADEGVMPQTREHFDICRLLEVKSGLVVITKTDLVDSEMRDLVRAEIEDFVAGSFLEGAPILDVSSKTGDGIEELKRTLVKIASQVGQRDDRAVARLPIDRVFTIKGFGTVVTGTLVAGTITNGDELDLLPSDGLRSKVRGVQVHGKTTSQARAGERTAINLQGLDLDQISRGQVLAPAGRLAAAQMLDVRLYLLPSAPKPLRNRSRVRLHHGTAEVLGRVILLGKGEVAPGNSAWAQIRLDKAIIALPSDRFIIRRYSPSTTIGGGTIVDAIPSKHSARDAVVVIERLERLLSADPVGRIGIFVEMTGNRGVDQKSLAARCGSTDEVIRQAADHLARNRQAVVISTSPLFMIAREPFEALQKRVREILAEHHRMRPLESGLGREELRERAFSGLDVEIFKAVISHMNSRNEIVTEKDLLRLTSHRVVLSDAERAVQQTVASRYFDAGFQPQPLDTVVQSVSVESAMDRDRVLRFSQMLVNSGELVKIGDLVFHRQILDSLRQTLSEYKSSHGPRIDVGIFKELTGVTRKYAIPLLEYLDRQRITRRTGETREIL